jgi:hypothetical protein
MISKLFGAVFTPKYPRGYTGRHRATDTSARSGPTTAPAVTIVGGPQG